MSTRRERAKMSTTQLNKQLSEKEETSQFLKVQSKKNLHTAEIYIDTAKIVLAGVAIGNLFGEKQYSVYYAVAGFVMSLILLGIGNKYFNKGNKGF